MTTQEPKAISSDVLVIGGGLAGLTAAATAARAGASVTLVEKSRHLGGRASTQERDGFLLNQGAHALYRGGIGRRVLRDLGVELAGGTPSPAGGFAIAGGEAHAFPAGFLSLLSTSLLSWSGKADVARILATLPRTDTARWQPRTVSSTIAELTARPEVQQLLRALIRLSTYGNDPDRQSGGDAFEQLKLALSENVIYLDGGWQTLVSELERIAREAGTSIVSASRIDRLEVRPDQVVARAGAAEVRAHSAILAIRPADAAELIDGAAADRLRGWAENAVPALAACLDVCLDSLPNPRATFGLGIDDPVYASVHSAVARLAPPDGALIQCMRYLGPTPSADSAADERAMEETLDLLQPGWRGHVRHKRFLPNMVVVHDLPGAAGGGLQGRPGPAVPGCDNLFVAGDWVGNEGLLADASLASGRRAGELAASRPSTAAAA